MSDSAVRASLSACALMLVACGSSEAPAAPVVTPEPPASVAPSAPEPPPSSAAPDLPAAPQVPVEVAALAPGGALPLTQGTFEMFHTPIALDVVGYSPEVQQAILTQLRAATRDALADFDPRSEDPEYPNTFSARCQVTLALADLVSYSCSADLSIGRGGGDEVQYSRTWEIVGDAAREVETDDLLVAGANLDAVTEPYDANAWGGVGLTPTGIAFADLDGTLHEVPYADLGTLLNRSSILSRVPGALDTAGVVTPLARDAAPPETISVLAEPHPLPAAVLLGARGEAGWLFSVQGGTPLDLTTPATPEAESAVATRLGGTATVVPWSTPARLGDATLRRATALRSGPHGRPSGALLPAGTVVFTVLGDLAAGPSRTGAGQWALVVASESSAGWVPSGMLGAHAPGALARIDAFLAALPAQQAASARAGAIAMAIRDDLIVCAETSPGTSSLGLFMGPADTSRPASAPRLVVNHAGTVADVRRLSAEVHGGTPLLLVAWQLPGVTNSWLWEAYAIPPSGTEPAAPVLSTTLALPSAPPRERVTLTTGIMRRGAFYPVVVRGPGRIETLYTWNGSALTAPAPAPP